MATIGDRLLANLPGARKGKPAMDSPLLGALLLVGCWRRAAGSLRGAIMCSGGDAWRVGAWRMGCVVAVAHERGGGGA